MNEIWTIYINKVWVKFMSLLYLKYFIMNLFSYSFICSCAYFQVSTNFIIYLYMFLFSYWECIAGMWLVIIHVMRIQIYAHFHILYIHNCRHVISYYSSYENTNICTFFIYYISIIYIIFIDVRSLQWECSINRY